MSDRLVHRALLSVSNKMGLVTFAQGLQSLGVELISTGGTHKALADAGLKVKDISEVTGFPEILDGRVKTLHPNVHGGILARRDIPEHMQTLAKHGIAPIDLVVCNLYPFQATVAKASSSHDDIIENIDIGGPTQVRAAAKNYQDVACVTDPEQYANVLEEMKRNQGALSLATRQQLAAAAFFRIAEYDRSIADYFAKLEKNEAFPATTTVVMERKSTLRYGENPHQQAAFYAVPGFQGAAVATSKCLHGKELSFNNLLDLDSALNLVREFALPAAVVIKHNNPCGVAVAETLEEAFKKAHEGDPLSAYGGVFSFNRVLDAATAKQITEPNRFVEAIIAPDFTAEAFDLLTTRPTWKNSVRLLKTGELNQDGRSSVDYRCIEGGFLVQNRDIGGDDFASLKVATKRPPTDAELADLKFAWLVCKHVKSNAIVYAKDRMIVGVGAGQMSRVDSVHIAGRKAGERSKGAVMASDAFFPFRDNIDEAHKAGIVAVIQPGGSIRDKDSVAACDEFGMAMVLTGVRHFRH